MSVVNVPDTLWCPECRSPMSHEEPQGCLMWWCPQCKISRMNHELDLGGRFDVLVWHDNRTTHQAYTIVWPLAWLNPDGRVVGDENEDHDIRWEKLRL